LEIAAGGLLFGSFITTLNTHPLLQRERKLSHEAQDCNRREDKKSEGKKVKGKSQDEST
jgi:hypothetical protein